MIVRTATRAVVDHGPCRPHVTDTVAPGAIVTPVRSGRSRLDAGLARPKAQTPPKRYQRAMTDEARAKRAEYARRWRAEHREHHRAYMRAYKAARRVGAA